MGKSVKEIIETEYGTDIDDYKKDVSNLITMNLPAQIPYKIYASFLS